MKPHVKKYTEYFGYSGFEYMPCEICKKPANQVHHIHPRGMGGSKQKDYIENLLGCCFECHRKCESGEISKSRQMWVHLKYMGNKAQK
jgi:5-methylcytosine-specific restriction endonuclease McrA